MRQVAGRSLWLGHAGDLLDPRPSWPPGSRLSWKWPTASLSPRCRATLSAAGYPLSDGGENRTWLLRLAAESVAALIRAGVPTLVCCAVV